MLPNGVGKRAEANERNMRRKRRLSWWLGVLCLLCCGPAVAVCLMSAWTSTAVVMRPHYCSIDFGRVTFVIDGEALLAFKLSPIRIEYWVADGPPRYYWSSWRLCRWDTYVVCITFPAWLFPLLFALGSVLFFWRARRRRRDGVCRKCGYLLIGLTSPRCPECGMAFEATVTAASPGESANE